MDYWTAPILHHAQQNANFTIGWMIFCDGLDELFYVYKKNSVFCVTVLLI